MQNTKIMKMQVVDKALTGVARGIDAVVHNTKTWAVATVAVLALSMGANKVEAYSHPTYIHEGSRPTYLGGVGVYAGIGAGFNVQVGIGGGYYGAPAYTGRWAAPTPLGGPLVVIPQVAPTVVATQAPPPVVYTPAPVGPTFLGSPTPVAPTYLGGPIVPKAADNAQAASTVTSTHITNIISQNVTVNPPAGSSTTVNATISSSAASTTTTTTPSGQPAADNYNYQGMYQGVPPLVVPEDGYTLSFEGATLRLSQGLVDKAEHAAEDVGLVLVGAALMLYLVRRKSRARPAQQPTQTLTP